MGRAWRQGSSRRFRPGINTRAPNALLNAVTQGVLSDGHAGALLDEDTHAFAFSPRPSLSTFLIPGYDRDVLCRRAAFSGLAMDVGALAAHGHAPDVEGNQWSRGNRAAVAGFAMAALQPPAPLSNVEGLKSVFDLALAEVVRADPVHLRSHLTC
jgi:hypothetical protein